MTLAATGSANVTTGLPVLDYLIGELARSARFQLALEVAPGAADDTVVAAGRAVGRAVRERLGEAGAAGSGWALRLRPRRWRWPCSIVTRPRASSPTSTLRPASRRAVHRRRVAISGRGGRGCWDQSPHQARRGTDPQHVLAAIFKAVGAALGQACRPVPFPKEERS